MKKSDKRLRKDRRREVRTTLLAVRAKLREALALSRARARWRG